jgi:hypothetical protein
VVLLYQTHNSHTLSHLCGVHTDSKKLYKSHLLDDLEEIAIALGQDFVAFGDSAYPIHRFFQHVLKCPKGGSLTRPERLLNALNARFRFCNSFACLELVIAMGLRARVLEPDCCRRTHKCCRIVIENLFAQVTCSWRSTGDGKNIRMGDMDAGSFFKVAVFFSNIVTLFRGNQVADYFDCNDLLLETSVSEYMRMAAN